MAIFRKASTIACTSFQLLVILMTASSSVLATHSFSLTPPPTSRSVQSPILRKNKFINDGKATFLQNEKNIQRENMITSLKGGESQAKGPPPGLLRRTFPNFPWHRLPDYLTYLRCLLIPVSTYTFYAQNLKYGNAITSFIFAIASFTDWLDGFLARRWDVSTAFGAFLDPVADKLMVSNALIILSGKYGPIIGLPSSIILAREIAVSALREWMAQKGLRDVVKVGFQGKLKTAATMVSLTILLFTAGPESTILWNTGLGLLYLSTVLTITSASLYFKAAAPVLLEKPVATPPPPPPSVEETVTSVPSAESSVDLSNEEPNKI